MAFFAADYFVMLKKGDVMGLFDIFRNRSEGVDTDRILSPRQIKEVLSDTGSYGNDDNAVIFVAEQSKPITPVDLMLVPFLQAEFSQNSNLGMVYGTGSGCALISKQALRKAQKAHKTGQIKITSCKDLIDTLRKNGYIVKQDSKLSIDLLP